MTLFAFIVLVIALGVFPNMSKFESLNELRLSKPVPEVRIGVNAMKNFVLFVLIFAALYWVQVQFGDAEAWLEALQRNQNEQGWLHP
jgi:hypothetical protein